MKLSIVVPVHNEENNILSLIERIESSVSIPYELVVVNDYSTDRTQEVLDKASSLNGNIRVVQNRLAPGFANALRTGFACIRGDVIVPIMGDSCDDLNTIDEMFSKILQGYDIVCGCRYTKGGGRFGGSKIKGFLSYFAGKSLYYLLGIPTQDIANAYKMYRKKVLDAIDIKSSAFEISMEIPLKAYYMGFKITDVPTVWNERSKGRSNFKILKLLPNYLRLYVWAIIKKITG